ncbi:MAG: D-tyrosyl-tRNA(Tyr) deacylase [Firmicutes bacterium]|nr:D-tyrosyl-tRNA(Tyr) deacylase [Bacillota bacterium]
MRVVIQRVRSASVLSEGQEAGKIGMGLLLYIGVVDGDTEADMKYIADKIPYLRIFPDENDKMNLSVLDVGGEILAVSQFTLAADCSHGRRPSFTDAMAPEPAEKMYDDLVALWRSRGIKVETGVFQTSMLVSSENWGPVTFILESKK